MALDNPVTVEVNGLAELEKALQAVGQAAAGKALRSALRAGLLPIRKDAEARIPVGRVPHYVGRKAKGKLVQPGHLRTQMRAKALRDEEFSGMVALTFSGDGFYAMFHEFGTAKMPARPILRPAFDTQKDAALARFKERLAAAIEKARQKAYEESARASR